MVERFMLYDSAVRLMGATSTMSEVNSKWIANAAREYAPYYRPTWTIDIDDARTRRSRRNYGKKRLQFAELAGILFMSMFYSEDPLRRPYPAAGAIYCNQAYVVARCVTGLPKGVYFLRWVDRSIERIGPIDERFVSEAVYQENKEDIDCIVLLIADIALSRAKYHDRSIRFALLEAGALMQTIYLAAERVGASVCGLGAIGDSAAIRLCQRELSKDVFLSAALSVSGKPNTPAV